MNLNAQKGMTSIQTISEFEEIFNTYYARLCNYAYKLLLDHYRAEDAVQQVFSKLWEKRGEYNINTSIQSYLYKATYNMSINEIKRTQKFNALENEELVKLSDFDADVANNMNELETAIEKALSIIPEKCRAIFVMSRYEEMKYKDIAQNLGISIKTVENQMGKALKLMRMHLSEFISVVLILLMK